MTTSKFKISNKVLSVLLCLAMLLSYLPLSSITVFTAFAADGAETTTTETRSIMLGTSHITGGQTSNVYFGNYQQSSLGNTQPTDGTEGIDWIKSTTAVNNEQGAYYKKEPIKWRVLSNADGKAFLLSDKNLDAVRYHEDYEYVTWEKSTIRSWLNGYGATSNQNSVDYSNDNFINAAFGEAEKGVITDTAVVTDKVFLLSMEEAQNTSYFANDNSRKAVNTAYVYGGGKSGSSITQKVGEAGFWWLRSPGISTRNAAFVNTSGRVYVNGTTVRNLEVVVRPAFYLNLSSVLFTSAASGGKPTGTGLTATTAYTGNEYKLTLLDGSRNAFEATISSISGNTVTVSYSDAKTGDNEYISAIIKNGSTVKYYGRLGLASESGTATVTLPDDFNAANGDVLCIFNEQYNGDYKTDYASELIEFGYKKITFDAGDGECATASLNTTLDGKLTSLPTPTRENYRFNGWYTAATGGDKVDTDKVYTADTTLYAQWTPVYWTDKGNYDLSWYNDPNAYLYTISDGADLAGLAVLVNGMHGETATTFAGKTINIGAEIDLSAYLWKPIGCDSDHYFSGTLNGSNQTITGMMVNETNAEFNGVGLFGCANGMIRDLTVTNSTVVSDGYHTGGIVGCLENTTLLNCSYSGTVTGFSIVGGLVGTPYNSNVHKCTNYATVTVTGTDGNAGGIAGDSLGYIDNCANFGEIKGTNTIGGVAGRISSGSVKNSYSIGAVSATNGDYVGGIAAYVYPPSYGVSAVDNCYYLGSTATAGLYSANATFKAGVFSKTADEFKSGEVAWLLNGSVDGGSNWYQNLDNGKTKDDNPVLLSTHGKVYQFITYAQCDKGDTNPVITYSNSDTSDVVPAHVYQYKATDNVITETCKNCETHTETATIKIDSSVDLVYAPDTEHKPATVEYSDGWQGGTLTVTYENNINAGTDTAKAIIEKDGEKATLSFSIKQAKNEWSPAPTISGWTYGETASTPNYKAKFGTVKTTYKGTTITGKEYPESTTPPTEAGSYTATFTVDETTNYSGLSETKEFTVSVASIKEAKVAASDVAYTGKEQKPTVTVTLGGKTLTENTDYTVSYSDNTNLGTATVTVTGKGNYTDSASGNFKIDYLATDAEAAVSGTKGKNDWYIGTVTLTAPTAPTGYKISKTVNGEYTDTISYDAEQNETVTYYLQNTSGEIAQKTLALKIDLTDPTAQYNIKGNGWREFVNFITFGIFCKDDADLEIKAADDMSAVTVEYKISKTELTAEDITDWTAYTGKVALNPQAKNYIYIKVTDDAGRTVVYESGVVVFTDCAETVNIEYFKNTDKDITAQIDLNGNTVKEIKYGDVSLTNEQYTVTDNGIKFVADYLDTFAASETPYTFTVSYHPMGVEMGADAEGDTPANTTISLTVKKQSGEVSNISELGKNYDGSAVSAPTYTSKSTGKATVEYKVKGTDDATYSETAPKNAGTYVVRVKVAADENYNEAYATAEFTISKVTLTVTAENKDATYGDKAPTYTVTYDGFKGNDDKNVLGGALAFDCGYAQFSDKGEYTITPKGYESVNYDFVYKNGKLTVGAKEITVTIDSKTSIYGDETVALTATDNGIVNNDKDVYKLTTNAGKTADVGKYDITGEALDGNYSITFANEADAYEITTRELTVSVVVADKKYDGLNTAAITSAVLNNVANNDAVALVNGTATFTTVNAADGIAISLTDFALSGEADVLKNYTLTQPTGIKANITNDWTPTEYVVSTPNSNGWLNADLVITAKDGYELSLTNTADGVWSETLTGAVEGADSSVTFYVRNKADGTISLAKTENYKLDKNTETTTTTGKVEFVERNSWQEFVNNITFGLFFKDEVTVKAEATDALSGVASIEYYEADELMTLDEVKAIKNWIAYNDSFGVSVEDTKKFIYFVRITDKAGNVTYLSTDGAEYDTTLPAISGIESGETYYTTQVVTVEDKNLASVELDGETVTLDNGTLTLAGNVDATHTIKVTDKAGNIIEYTVTMKTIAELTKSLDDITVGDVTSDDKEIIEQVIGDIDEQLANDDLTEDEKAALEETKDKAKDLLDKIDEAANADDTDNTEKVKDITADNVTPEDKSDLEKAKDDLTKTLDDYSDNLTEDEKKAIEDEIKRIDDALEVIGNVEAVEDKIGSLPENITKNDEAAIKAADDAYNALSDYEKSLVDKDAKKALDDAKAALAELNKPADTTSPNTGDNSNLWLWVALLFISGGATITLTVYDRKKRAAQK